MVGRLVVPGLYFHLRPFAGLVASRRLAGDSPPCPKDDLAKVGTFRFSAVAAPGIVRLSEESPQTHHFIQVLSQ